MGVEPLEGRVLLSRRYFFSPKLGSVVNNVADVRHAEPRFGSGVAVLATPPRFNPWYQGLHEPQLLATQATARVTLNSKHLPDTLVLTGTVAGPINTRPKTDAQGAIYTFGIDTGAASWTGPFPGRPNIRFNAVVVVTINAKGISGYTSYRNVITNAAVKNALPASAIKIRGNTVTVTIPAVPPSTNASTSNAFPSGGHALDQWNVVFFPSYPSGNPSYLDVASLVPQYTDFQVYYPPFPPPTG